MELSSSNIKKFLIFSQQKSFLIFQETETLKNLLYFRNNFPSPKNEKNPLIFREMELPSFPSSKVKKFQEELQKSQNQTKNLL